MRIGIDIDNTICSTSKLVSKFYEEEYGKSFYELEKYSQYEYTIKVANKVFYDCPLEKNAKEVIERISKNNYIYLITARNGKTVKNIENITLEYLRKNGIKYNAIYFNNDSKLEMYKELKLDIMLDDDYMVYKELTENGYLAYLYPGSLNKNKIGNRVKDWIDFEDIIKEMKNNG